jgi:hypothetical protein
MEKWNISAEDLLSSLGEDEFGEDVIRAWTEGIKRNPEGMRSRHPSWAATLWDWWKQRSFIKNKDSDESKSNLIQLLPVLSSPDAERRVELLLQRGTAAREIGLALVQQLSSPWTIPFSSSMIHRARSAMLTGGTIALGWAELLVPMATALAPELVDEALMPMEIPEDTEKGWQGRHIREQVGRMTEILEIRRDFRDEINRIANAKGA